MRLTTALLALLVPAPALALDVLVIYDTTGSDTADLVTALETAGHTVDYSDYDETRFDGTNPSLSSYDVVVHLDGATAYSTEMKPAGQAALETFVYAGGGYVGGEYNAYEADLGRHGDMDDLVLLEYASDTSGTLSITPESDWEDHGLFTDVSTFSVTGYYTEAWLVSFSSSAAEVVATEGGGYDAIAVREWGSGRAVHFAWAPNMGSSLLADTDVLQMYVNAVAWASGQCDADGDERFDTACGGSDCDDTDSDVHDLADEVCDGDDNNCDGITDTDAIDATTYYDDDDGDGYGDPDDTTSRCVGSAPTGYVSDDTDCDDTDSSVNPAASEVCDFVDNDCDGDWDEEATDASTFYADDDGDGFGDPGDSEEMCWELAGYTTDDSDCDDMDEDVNPDMDELCDGVDQDCDEDVDEDAVDATTWYRDLDGDGWGYEHASKVECDQPGLYVDAMGDCDDYNDTVYPGAEEVAYDGVDQDCDGEDVCDLDGDGFDSDACPGGQDCDDADAAVNPLAEETWYDGVDQDCDGASDFDADGDGHDTEASGGDDCDDDDPDIHPGAPELEDGIDNDCDGVVETDDSDGDGLLDVDELALGTDPRDPDSDHDGVPDGVEMPDPLRPPDEDKDGLIDPLDDDDDDDGIPTREEIGDYDWGDPESVLPDTDGDGIPNHLDRDSDNDGWLDADEGTGDYDCDGKADYVDRNPDDGDCYGGGSRTMGCMPSVEDGSAVVVLLPLPLLGLVRRRRR